MTLGFEAYAPNFINTRGYEQLFQKFNEISSQQDSLVEANSALLDLESETVAVFKALKDQFSVRFPELATFELNSLQYAKVILLLLLDEGGSNSALNTSRLNSSSTGGLPNATVMIISVTAATTNGRKLSENEFSLCREAAEMLVQMDSVRQAILKYIESQMESVAPNVSALVGVQVASQLIGAAGGVVQLSRIPAGNIQVIGSGGRKHLSGLSSASVGLHSGFIATCPLMEEVAPDLGIKAQRLLSAKVAIASRLDASGDQTDGSFGRKLYDEIVGKLETLSAPPPLKSVKPLPIPDSERKKRRGGKRARKLKELYAQSELGKQKNRLAFGETAEREVFVGDRMEGMGMLGSGNLRALSGTSETDSRLREHLKKHANHKLSTTGSSGSKSVNNLLQTNNTITLTPTPSLAQPQTQGPNTTSTTPNSSKFFNLSSGFKRNKD